MGRAEAGTPKAIANAMKAKGEHALVPHLPSSFPPLTLTSYHLQASVDSDGTAKYAPNNVAMKMASRCILNQRREMLRPCQRPGGGADGGVKYRHLRKMLVVGENAGKHIDDFSKAFLDDFIQMLSRR
jgi:hypothetical protein